MNGALGFTGLRGPFHGYIEELSCNCSQHFEKIIYFCILFVPGGPWAEGALCYGPFRPMGNPALIGLEMLII